MNNTFKKYNLCDEIIKALDGIGYKHPSDVQSKVIPEVLNGKDIIVKSQTGSGKTAAFGIPLCEKVIWEERTHDRCTVCTVVDVDGPFFGD